MDLFQDPRGSSVQIPSYRVPCFQKVCSEVRGPRPQQVSRTPELPFFLQQPLLALDKAPAHSLPAATKSQLPCQLLVLRLQQQEQNQFCLARYFCQSSVPGLCSCMLPMQSLRVQLASSGSHCSCSWWLCKL